MTHQPYDSRPDTEAHIEKVRHLVGDVIIELAVRARLHDQSKLEEPEKSAFDSLTPLLKSLTYGSKEYEAARASLGDALRHHYQHNRHHPEHHPREVLDMNLVDLIEMLCDWRAASLRHDDGDIRQSLLVNRDRFNLPECLFDILCNTVEAMGW